MIKLRKYVYGWVNYSKEFYINNKFGGFTVGPFMWIKEKYKNDVGLLEHEKYHAKQFWKLPFLGMVLYGLSQRWRYKEEITAYKIQLSYVPNHMKDSRRRKFAEFISTRYKLDVPVYRAYEDLG